MKTLFFSSILLLLFLGSCAEYSSDFPIDTIENSYPKDEIYGSWDFIWNSEDDDPHNLLIFKYNDKEYLVLFFPQDSCKAEDLVVMKSHLTKIGDNEFANSRLISDGSSDEETEYMIHKIKVEGNKLTFSAIPAKLIESLGLEFNSMQDHYNFISKNAENLPYWTVRYEYKRSE